HSEPFSASACDRTSATSASKAAIARLIDACALAVSGVRSKDCWYVLPNGLSILCSPFVEMRRKVCSRDTRQRLRKLNACGERGEIFADSITPCGRLLSREPIFQRGFLRDQFFAL